MWKANEYIEKKKEEGKNIYVWGTGQKCRQFVYSFRDKPTHIVGIIDDEVVDKWSTYLEDYPIISSNDFFEKKEDKFVVIVKNVEEAIEVLTGHGMSSDEFITLKELISYGFGEVKDYEEVDKPLINQMDVKITYACNFRCEYCYQADAEGNHETRYLSKENAENLVKFAEKLNDTFYITLAGGEPFVYPHLQYLVEELTGLGNHISIITNFSAPYEKIEALILAAREKLATFNISIHLTQWKNMEVFYEKLRRVLDLIDREEVPLTIRTTCVLTEDNFSKLIETDSVMKERFPEVPFEIQRVYHNNVYEIYSEEVENFMRERGLDVPIEKANNIDFYGRKCWAGSKFFYIEVDGEVRRCYTNQFNRDSYVLGNLSEVNEIKAYDNAMPCLSIHGGNCICYGNFVNLKMVTEKIATKEDVEKFYAEE